MAREAVLRDTNIKTSRRFTISSSVAIPKHTYLKCADAYTASASTGTGDFFVGFAHSAKDASDSSTSMTADKGGVYELVASGAIVVGQFVKTASPGNYVMACTDADLTASYSRVVGVALETASNDETINVEVFA